MAIVASESLSFLCNSLITPNHPIGVDACAGVFSDQWSFSVGRGLEIRSSNTVFSVGGENVMLLCLISGRFEKHIRVQILRPHRSCPNEGKDTIGLGKSRKIPKPSDFFSNQANYEQLKNRS